MFPYDLIYKTEKDAIAYLLTYIVTYSRLHPTEKIIVITDSPDGIAEDGGDIETERTLDFMVKKMKHIVACNDASFYCISAESKNIFNEKRIKKLGPSRFKQIEQKNWIDLRLSIQEKNDLINKFQKINKITFNDQQIKELKMHNTRKIGEFLAALFDLSKKLLSEVLK